jgi:hypothetical protein
LLAPPKGPAPFLPWVTLTVIPLGNGFTWVLLAYLLNLSVIFQVSSVNVHSTNE